MCVSGIRVVSQPFCVDKLDPAGLISVCATLPIYLIDQVSSLQRRAERRIAMNTESIHFFLLMKICAKKRSTAGEYTKEGENICPPSKIIYMKYILILLDRMFLTLKHVVINIYKYSVKTIF